MSKTINMNDDKAGTWYKVSVNGTKDSVLGSSTYYKAEDTGSLFKHCSTSSSTDLTPIETQYGNIAIQDGEIYVDWAVGAKYQDKTTEEMSSGEIFNDYDRNVATGEYSSAFGEYTIANGSPQVVIGRFNAEDSSKYFIIGGGTADTDRKNIVTVDSSGNIICGTINGVDVTNTVYTAGDHITITGNVISSDTYSQTEIDEKVSKIPKFDIKVVTELPTTEISDTTVYLVPTSQTTSEQDLYTEYIHVNGAWEVLGTQKLSIDSITEDEINKLFE